MSYDDSSLRGNELCWNMDEQNNIMNPPSDTGWFIYNLFKGLDFIDESISNSINNRLLESAEGLYLDINWGRKYEIARNGLSDDIYRKILIAASHETLTVYGIRNTLSLIFECEYSEIIVITDDVNVIRATDNINNKEYDEVVDVMTNLDNIDKFVTDRLSSSIGGLTVKYPAGLNLQVDEDTTLIDLIKPYIGLVHINYTEYIA